MPKNTPKPTSENVLVRTADVDGNEIEVPMTGAYFSDGRSQSLYWQEGHPQAGWFKGMAQIVKEWGWENAYKIRAKCKKCDYTRTDYCSRRILFNEPDFSNPSSVVERLVTSRGHGFLLLPKFHPELNSIEQCWAKAKWLYREFPESTGEKQLERNVEAALDGVLLNDIRKFCTRSRRWCDGYTKGLTGGAAVYAANKYHGHRQYPNTIFEKIKKAKLGGGKEGFRAKL
ncbi:hypothetical protein FRC08_004532 [Ceratobasidium sp. 394]|nr:hypothetical protein FRC08_004532 [Ceratobasidium sp. 394]